MKKDSRPNILFIFTDQQSFNMMSCTGNPYLKTPAMDSLAVSGMRFERAYCTNPICVPSRFSLMTGRLPSEIGLRNNDADKNATEIPQYIKEKGLGWLFRNNGYDAVYGGRQHLPKMTVEDLGFEYITADERDDLAEVCEEFIKKDREKPFLLIASFINPHDICLMAIRDHAQNDQEKLIIDTCKKEIETLNQAMNIPVGIDEEKFFEKYCPPLPENFEVQLHEPEAVRRHQEERPFKRKTRENYTEKQWRMHRWAYCRLIEMVDKQIGRVLDSLRESGKADDTVIIFSSDHGDMDAAHRMEHKELLYEEACRIPLIICQRGKTVLRQVDSTHLVSNGLDLLPTFCDYAGIKPPENMKGRSLKNLVEVECDPGWRTVLPIEAELGKAIITGRYKYVLYDEGENREQLYDLNEDLVEMRNFACIKEYKNILEEHRIIFNDIFPFK